MDKAKNINKELKESGLSYGEISKFWELSIRSIRRINRGKNKRITPKIFKEKEISYNSSDQKRRLGDRKDFWNVPCNPITGYRLIPINRGNPNLKVKEEFFKDTSFPYHPWK